MDHLINCVSENINEQYTIRDKIAKCLQIGVLGVLFKRFIYNPSGIVKPCTLWTSGILCLSIIHRLDTTMLRRSVDRFTETTTYVLHREIIPKGHYVTRIESLLQKWSPLLVPDACSGVQRYDP